MSGQNGPLHPAAAAAAQQLQQIQRTQRFLQEKTTSSLVNQHSIIKQETSQESPVSVPNRQQQNELNLPHGRHMAATHSCLSDELDRTQAMNTCIRTHEKTLSSLSRKELISNGNQNSKSNIMTNGSSTITTTTTPTPTGVQMPVRSRTEPSPEEMTDLEELEQFAKMFKQRRIKLGE